MTTDRDFDRLARAWLDLMPDEAPDRVIASVMAAAAITPQARRRAAIRWRLAPLSRVALASAVLAIAAVTTAMLLARSGPEVGGSATASPDRSAANSSESQYPLTERTPPFVHNGEGATGIRLADGRVAILGGGGAEVEIWDPSTNTLRSGGQLTFARTDAMAALLADGRVLLVGGREPVSGALSWLKTAEVYDPATGTSTPTGSMYAARTTCACGLTFGDWAQPAAVDLLDGRVLIVGGLGSRVADLYDPVGGTFSQASVGCDAGRGAQARLADGRVLITCFALALNPGSAPENTARIFDPRTNEFAPTGSPTTTNSGSATLLPDGRVLLTGDAMRVGRSPAEVFDPTKNAFAALPGNENTRLPAVTLADGRILFAGQERVEPWIFDPSTMRFSAVRQAVGALVGQPVALADGRVLVVRAGSGVVVDAAQLP